MESHRRDRLAEICGQYLGNGQMVSLEGRLQTRRWEDDRKLKHYRTEIVASSVEMLSGRRKKDYAAEAAAQALETQAELMGLDPVDGDDFEALSDEDDESDEPRVSRTPTGCSWPSSPAGRVGLTLAGRGPYPDP